MNREPAPGQAGTSQADGPSPALRWVKSSHSGPTGGNCVEVAGLGDGRVAIRDSWLPAGTTLVVPAARWRAFTTGTRDGVPG